MGLFEYGINRNFSILGLLILLLLLCAYMHDAGVALWPDACEAVRHDASMVLQCVRVSMWRSEANCGLS